MTGATAPTRRGAPLVLLGAVIAGWIVMRALAWEVPFAWQVRDAVAGIDNARASQGRVRSPLAAAPSMPARVASPTIAPAYPYDRPVSSGGKRVAGTSFFSAPNRDIYLPQTETIVSKADNVGVEPSGPVMREQSASQAGAQVRDVAMFEASRPHRWHADAWVAIRQGGGATAVAAGGPAAPAYGKSQAGLLLRRDLASIRMSPQAYVRATYAPDRPSQADLAAGLSLRPLDAVPVRLHGEARLTRVRDHTEVRPAVVAVSELPIVRLPLGFKGEGYAQAGWVGGRFATGFVDGQARIERQVTAVGGARLRAGAGVWGGAQKFASRLDLGPSATLDLRDSGVPVRVAVDYRIKLAGSASPGDGVAITLSTGF